MNEEQNEIVADASRELIDQCLFDIESSNNIINAQLVALKEVLSMPLFNQEKYKVTVELERIFGRRGV